jgi:hypothetical protein
MLRRVGRILAALSIVLLFGLDARAQSTSPPPTPADVLSRIQARYRSGPVCERMRVEVRTDGGRVARSWVVVRLDAAKSVTLELGALRIAADGKAVTAVHDRNPQTVFTAAMPGEGALTLARLWQVIPPVPLPQFDLAAAADLGRLPSLAYYARDVQWDAAAPEPRALAGVPSRVTLTGHSDRGKITLMAKGDQLQALDIRDDVQGVTVRLQISPILPCKPEDARVDASGRTVVPQLADLQPRSGVLRTGAAVPEMQLSTAAGQVQRLKELLTPPAEFLPAPESERLVLVFTRLGKDPIKDAAKLGRVEADVLGRELTKLQREAYGMAAKHDEPPAGSGGAKTAEEAAPLLPTFNFAQVMVMEAPSADALLALLKREREAWGDHLAWTTNAKSSVDLFATSGESMVIMIGRDQRLQSAIPITDRTTTEELLDQISAALLERAD